MAGHLPQIGELGSNPSIVEYFITGILTSAVWVGRINGDSADCKSAASGTTGSIPVQPTKNLALLIIMAVNWFCNPEAVVRFHQRAPVDSV